MSTYQKIQQEINAIVSLRYHRAIKENEALLPSLCNSDDQKAWSLKTIGKLISKKKLNILLIEAFKV